MFLATLVICVLLTVALQLFLSNPYRKRHAGNGQNRQAAEIVGVNVA
jgi:hypothetical protein